MTSILPDDTGLKFPNFTVISASAGSGKTHTLTLKLLQLLLSRRVPNNSLKCILAMTFTKNAAAEMRKRVLEYLKKGYLGNGYIIQELMTIVPMEKDQLQLRCGEMIDAILKDYSTFQIQTIDSFMARIFRASALEFGFSPTVEVIVDNQYLLDEAFEQFTRNLSSDSTKRHLLEDLTDLLIDNQSLSSRFIWDPFHKISHEVRNLYNTLSSQSKELISLSHNKVTIDRIRREILDTFQKLNALVQKSGLEITENFKLVKDVAVREDVDDLIERKSLYALPVKRSGSSKTKEKVKEWSSQFTPLQEKLSRLASDYVLESSKSYYYPYAEAHRFLRNTIGQIMHINNKVTLSYVNHVLLSYISEEIVPQVYYYLGDSVFHYLIDEFQDTSIIQWEALKPLLAEALSKRGSLFVVGDTKQSIYSFRHADWRIMKDVMATDTFPSAPTEVRELDTNYRSYERIHSFNKTVFHSLIPERMEGEAPHASGLSTFIQKVKEGNENKGYVEIVSFDNSGDNSPERNKILEIISDCRKRGYRYCDITILTPKNEHVVDISGWLNSEEIPFVSHSSLDIRGRKITGEIIALMRFLDSPIDDLAFSTILLSETFHRLMSATNKSLTETEIISFIIQDRKDNRKVSLYTSFRLRYHDIWKQCFEELFTVVGYLPLYDLVSEIYKHFRLFELAKEEESTLTRFLEVIKNFEEIEQNNLKDFLEFVDKEGDEADWNISIPHGIDAVSVMTIHKSKGLDNRVVIVLLEDTNLKSNNLFIDNQENGVQLLRVTQKYAELCENLKALYNQRLLNRSVDDLNKLYVAFTRAKEEMYIVSLKKPKASEPSKFLPTIGFEPSAKPEVSKIETRKELNAATYQSLVSKMVEAVSAEKLAFFERRRGEVIHEILARIEYVDQNIEEVISAITSEITETTSEYTSAVNMKTLILEFLRLPEINFYFTRIQDRIILNEQEFVANDGRLFRMDRVVIDTDTVTVLDYKTGEEKDTYSDQINGYFAILQDLYPEKTIHGGLAYIDRKILRMVR